MKESLVSIIVPCYNSERWIEETLKSALAQTWRNIEVIVVDDGSKDNSLTVARKFESSRVKVISEQNQGASAARNRALSEAQGDYFQFLDADDLLAPNKIKAQLERLQKEDSRKIAACAWARFHHTVDDAQCVRETVWADTQPVEWLTTSWLGGGMMPNNAWLTPRAVAEEAGTWDNARCPNDDGEYFTRVILNSSGVAFVSETQSFYRSGIDNSWSRLTSHAMLAATLRSLDLCSTNLLARENTPLTRKACATLYQRFAFGTYPRARDLVTRAERRVKELGGAELEPQGGRFFDVAHKVIGWKLARQAQDLAWRYVIPRLKKT